MTVPRRSTAELAEEGYQLKEVVISTAHGSDPENLKRLLAYTTDTAEKANGILVHPDSSPRVELWTKNS